MNPITMIIKYYKKLRQEIINPDNFTDWSDVGLTADCTTCKTFDEWLEKETEFDEGEQVSIKLINEFLAYLQIIERIVDTLTEN